MAIETAAGRAFPRPHWGPVIAGVLVALAIHIVLGLVGAALGFAAGPADSRALGAGAAIWGLITPFVATLCGAWLASRAAASDDARAAGLQGVLVWCIGLIAGAVFLTGTMATGALTAGTAAGGNAGFVERIAPGPAGGQAPARGEAGAEEAAKAVAAATAAAALAAIAGLLGAIVGAGIASRRSSGRKLGWRVAIERRGTERGATASDRAYTPGPYAGAPEGRPVAPSPGPSPGVGSSSDPYHH